MKKRALPVLLPMTAGAVGLLIACVGDDPAVPPSPENDGGGLPDTSTSADVSNGDRDGAAEAGAEACDLAAPFEAAVPFIPVNTDADEGSLRFSNDGAFVYFSRGPVAQNSPNIMVATRASGFLDAVEMPGVNHPSGGFADAFPNVSADSTEILFGSNDGTPLDGGGPDEIKRATRPPGGTTWTRARLTGFPTGFYAPFVTPDGTALYFSDLDSAQTVKRAQRVTDGTFAAPVAVIANGNFPVVTGGEKTLYFARDGKTFSAKRAAGATVSFEAPQVVAELGASTPTWVSADGCQIAVVKQGPLSLDVYLADKPKKP